MNGTNQALSFDTKYSIFQYKKVCDRHLFLYSPNIYFIKTILFVLQISKTKIHFEYNTVDRALQVELVPKNGNNWLALHFQLQSVCKLPTYHTTRLDWTVNANSTVHVLYMWIHKAVTG